MSPLITRQDVDQISTAQIKGVEPNQKRNGPQMSSMNLINQI